MKALLIPKEKLFNGAIFALLFVGMLLFLFPFFWMISTSLKASDELFLYPPDLIPKKPVFRNYLEIWGKAPFGTYFFNSMVVTTAITVGEVATSALAAYAFSKISFPGRDKLFLAFLGTLMVPNQVEAMTLADQIVVMNNGAIMQEGAPMEVFKKPKNLFVAGFLGAPSMNFLKVRLSRVKQRPYLTTEGICVSLAEDSLTDPERWDGRELILGIRPEHLYLKPQIAAKALDESLVEGFVEFYEPLGSETLIHLKVGAQEVLAMCPTDASPPADSKLRFFVDPDKVRLFDPVSEASIP